MIRILIVAHIYIIYASLVGISYSIFAKMNNSVTGTNESGNAFVELRFTQLLTICIL